MRLSDEQNCGCPGYAAPMCSGCGHGLDQHTADECGGTVNTLSGTEPCLCKGYRPPAAAGGVRWRKSTEGTLHAFLGEMEPPPDARSSCGLVTVAETAEADLEASKNRPVCGHCNRYLQRIAMEAGRG